MTGSAAESDIWEGTIWGRTLLKSDSGLEWKFCGKSKPAIHYPVFISTKTRKQSQISLFSKWIPISILLITLSIYFNLCLPWQRCQKCLLAPTNVTTRKQRWRPQTPIGVAGISWTTNKSASARNTTVAFYPGVYQGVIYISAGKAVMMEYRLVNELYLDWIFKCINRGKIYNTVGGSVTHTQLPSR